MMPATNSLIPDKMRGPLADSPVSKTLADMEKRWARVGEPKSTPYESVSKTLADIEKRWARIAKSFDSKRFESPLIKTLVDIRPVMPVAVSAPIGLVIAQPGDLANEPGLVDRTADMAAALWALALDTAMSLPVEDFREGKRLFFRTLCATALVLVCLGHEAPGAAFFLAVGFGQQQTDEALNWIEKKQNERRGE